MLWTHEAKHNIHNIHVPENVFLERDQVRDTKKEQELYITFSQSD